MENKKEILNTVDIKMGLLQKYGWKGLIIFVITTSTPYLATWYDDYKSRQYIQLMKSEIKNEIAPFHNGIKEVKETLNRNLEVAVNAHAKTALSDKQTIMIAKKFVKSQSYDKIEQIRKHLKSVNPHDTEEFTKHRIKWILVKNTKMYVEELNSFVHPKIGRIGDYIWNTFPMDSFLNDMYAILLDTSVSVDRRCEIAERYMIEDAQESYFEKMKLELKK